MAIDKTNKKGSSSNKKSYGVLKQQNVHKTTIRKVSARKASSTHKKRTVSNVEVRKNLLTDDMDGSVASSADSGFVRPIQQSLFETGNKATILANFEEWIKLATDNKINVKNSWNFALIDYFHDLTVLKENNGNINFQKASATLDGCVKIYASRIDSVVNEAGKLLSGIVTANDNNTRTSGLQSDSANADGNGTMSTNANTTGIPVQEGDVVIDPQTGLPISVVNDNQQTDVTAKRRVNNRVLETTLTKFDNIKLSSFEEEFSIDPLFKKALADFDEAGAKNLLLSILHVQRDARVVFDSAKEYVPETDMNKDVESDKDDDMEDNNESRSNVLKPAIKLVYKGLDTEEEQLKAIDDNLLELGLSLNILSSTNTQKKLCSSLGLIRDSIQDITKVKDLIDSIGQEGSLAGESTADHGALVNDNVSNFEQFELNEASLIDNNDVDVHDDALGFVDEFDNINTEEYEQKAEQVFADDIDKNVMAESDDSEENFDLDFEKNLFSEFDGVFNNKAWTGKDHWKVKNIKKTNVSISSPINEISEASSDGQSDMSKLSNKTKRVRNKKLRTPIDFSDWSVAEEDVLKQAEAIKLKNESSIDIPIKNRKDPYYNLLPTDYHVTLEKMTVLFTRPHQKGNFFRKPIKYRSKWKDNDEPNGTHAAVDQEIEKSHEHEGEEQYWADMYEDLEAPDDLEGDAEDNNPNDFNLSMNVDMNNGLDFNDALGNDDDMVQGLSLDERSSEQVDENGLALNAGFMLSSIDMENEKKNEATTLKTLLQMNATQKVMYSRVAKKVDIKKLKDNIWRCIENQLAKIDSSKNKQLQFSSIIKQLKTLYTFDTLKDLSTSFCFICLLHLANEHGFRIDKDEVNLKELTIVF
ncbi:hypothetical protein ACO0R3_001948 [Hanseniaspora guilliermondii]